MKRGLTSAEVLKCELKQLADIEDASSNEGINDSVDPGNRVPYGAEWDDLIRLHELVLSRRVTTILEFGCGYSTLIFAHALAINAKEHGDFVRNNLRRNNLFEVHAVDDMPEFIDICMRRIPAILSTYVTIHESTVRMCLFNGRIATEYETLPNICPDLIYLDGPSQHSAMGNINGITTAHPDRLPMSCDLLRMEHFLLPGTLIVVDGRTANARFLEANFQRTWEMEHDSGADMTYFELQEQPLGKFNARQIAYCLPNGFLLEKGHQRTQREGA